MGETFYNGPSMITGDPIIGVITGLGRKSKNPKTGPMAQTWITTAGVHAMDARKTGKDKSICGDCPLRKDHKCYVRNLSGSLWKRSAMDAHPTFELSDKNITRLQERGLRMGAYGNPSAIPIVYWRTLANLAGKWTAYDHQWRDIDPEWSELVMASCESSEDREEAKAKGYRTFRILWPEKNDKLESDEILCPYPRVQCKDCLLCRGNTVKAKDIAIHKH